MSLLEAMKDEVARSVQLTCPCGRALDLLKMKDGRWVLGHIDSMCSPLISGRDLMDVLARFLDMGRLPRTEEHLSGLSGLSGGQVW